jgi:hypothetical protein
MPLCVQFVIDPVFRALSYYSVCGNTISLCQHNLEQYLRINTRCNCLEILNQSSSVQSQCGVPV